MEGKLKGMNNYETIVKYKHVIDLENLIRSVWHL